MTQRSLESIKELATAVYGDEEQGEAVMAEAYRQRLLATVGTDASQ